MPSSASRLASCARWRKSPPRHRPAGSSRCKFGSGAADTSSPTRRSCLVTHGFPTPPSPMRATRWPIVDASRSQIDHHASTPRTPPGLASPARDLEPDEARAVDHGAQRRFHLAGSVADRRPASIGDARRSYGAADDTCQASDQSPQSGATRDRPDRRTRGGAERTGADGSAAGCRAAGRQRKQNDRKHRPTRIARYFCLLTPALVSA